MRTIPALGTWERLLGCGGVLAYHGVTEESFLPEVHITVRTLVQQLDWLQATYHVVPLHEFMTRRRHGRSVRRCVAITFDDAYTGVLEFALPLLQQRQLPATVFVATGFSAPDSRFWWDRVEWVRRRADGTASDRVLTAISGDGQTAHGEVHLAVVAHNGGRLHPTAEAALAEAERTIPAVPAQPLEEQGLHSLAEFDLIDFGCHTVSHLTLPALPPVAQREEIERSHRWLTDRFTRVHPYLAYPYGLYNRATVRAAVEAGMNAAFTMQGHAPLPRFDPLTCPRVGVAQVNPIDRIRLRLSRVAIPLVVWRQGGWHPWQTRPYRHLAS